MTADRRLELVLPARAGDDARIAVDGVDITEFVTGVELQSKAEPRGTVVALEIRPPRSTEVSADAVRILARLAPDAAQRAIADAIYALQADEQFVDDVIEASRFHTGIVETTLALILERMGPQ